MIIGPERAYRHLLMHVHPPHIHAVTGVLHPSRAHHHGVSGLDLGRHLGQAEEHGLMLRIARNLHDVFADFSKKKLTTLDGLLDRIRSTVRQHG